MIDMVIADEAIAHPLLVSDINSSNRGSVFRRTAINFGDSGEQRGFVDMFVEIAYLSNDGSWHHSVRLGFWNCGLKGSAAGPCFVERVNGKEAVAGGITGL